MSPFWKKERRVDMSVEDLEGSVAGRDPESAFVDLYETLIADNPKANELEPMSWKLRKGQRILYTLTLFHYDMNNGGIEQYLWNQPGMPLFAQGYMERLGLTEMSEALEPFVRLVEDEKGEWYQARSAAWRSEEEALAAFRDSRHLVGGAAFNDRYYGASDSEGESPPSYGEALSKAVVDYVQENPGEFVRGG